jgi:hypothetical protein
MNAALVPNLRFRMFRIIAIFFIAFSFAQADDILCSVPSSLVQQEINKVVEFRDGDSIKYENALLALHSNKSDVATEAAVRLKSVYLGSWPGTANDCEIFKRGPSSLKYLDSNEYCLNESTVQKKYLSSHTPKSVQKNKQYIASKIRSPNDGWCVFDG